MEQSQLSVDMIDALNEAALAITEGLSLPRTLQKIADTARTLIQSKYAALGVLAEDEFRLKQFITSGLEPQIARHVHHEPRGEGLLGDIFIEEKPINVVRIQDDERSAGFCDNHPIMTSFLGMPITNRGTRIGNLYLCDRLDGKPFDQNDEKVLELLAAHAAIAIENATLHDELQSAALRSERDRIGMELHDGVIQSIYAVGMKVDMLQNKIDVSDDLKAQFGIVLDDLNHIIDDIRGYIQNLITARDEQVTLKSHIENIVTHFQTFSGVDVKVDISSDLPVLSDFQRHNFLQILREALANVSRHSEAEHVRVSLLTIDKDIVLRIEDDGKGFDEDHPLKSIAGHFGLFNIEQRARRMGGSLEIKSIRDQGAILIIHAPIKPA